MALIRLNNQSISSVTALPSGVSVGKILQVVSARQTLTEQWTSDNVVVGPTATITPSSTSNKILIFAQGMVSGNTSITGTMGMRYAVGTSVSNSDTLVGGGGSAGSRSTGIAWAGGHPDNWTGNNFGYHILHSPSTTSQISYRLCSLGHDTGSTLYLGRTGRDADNNDHPRTDTNITLMEIEA